MDNTVLIYMQAYNAEKTIKSALDSLHNQTYPDWACYCIDNGSTDRTGEMIYEYSQKDSRVIYNRVAKNNIEYFGRFIEKYIKHPLASYFAWLDADDEYEPNFLEYAMRHIRQNRLDCFVCGTVYIDAVSKEVQLIKKPETDLIISQSDFAEKFLEYRRFTDVLWGKVLSTSLLQAVDYHRIPMNMFAPDSVIVLELFKQCYLLGWKIGFLSQSLHRYYRAPMSLSQQFRLDVVGDIHTYFHAINDYLGTFGPISALNTDYLCAIWFGWMQDIFPRICSSKARLSDRLNALKRMIASPNTQKTLNRNADPRFRNLTLRREFCETVLAWISLCKNDPDCAADVGEITAVLEMNIDESHNLHSCV